MKDEDYRFTWVAADGTVLFDSEGDAANMENHKNREEVAEAFETGIGESSRYSQTLTEETVYYAKLLKDGTVLRVAVGRLTVLTIVLGMIQPLIVVIAITLILSLLLARRLSKKIVEPLNSIDLEKPLDNNAYDELSPMLTKIEKQRRLIDGQIRQLDANRAEFYTVIKSMKEGLVLLNDKGTVLSINPAAESVFGTDETCVGKDFLTVDRSLEVGKLLADAKTDGHAQMQSERKGKVYQLNASRIGTAANPAGIVLLVFDVTEKVFAERNRREFTSNVSHELMTPLHSIMGCSELMENGLVKEEDVPRFIERIHSESSKLMTLVEDIIELSELDENADLPRKDVDLLAIAKEETAVLAEEAAKNAANNANSGGNSGGSGGNSGGGGSSGGGSATSLSNLQWPVPSCTLITSRFGYRVAPTTGASTYHGGLDIGAGMGASIVAAGAGDVIYAGANGGYGNCVMIDHGNGVVTGYAHMSSIGVSYGQYVTAGQYVGAVGSTGVSTGPHCHFEIRINGVQTDPAAYFSGLTYWNC